MRKTLKHVLAEYGGIALTLYLTIFFLVLGGFWLAIQMGFREQLESFIRTITFGFVSPSAASGAVGFGLAYVLTKLTQPLRIALTVVLTPFVARAYERLRGERPRST